MNDFAPLDSDGNFINVGDLRILYMIKEPDSWFYFILVTDILIDHWRKEWIIKYVWLHQMEFLCETRIEFNHKLYDCSLVCEGF